MQVLNNTSTNTSILEVLQTLASLASDPEGSKIRLAELKAAEEKNQATVNKLNKVYTEVQVGEQRNKNKEKELADSEAKLATDKASFEVEVQAKLKYFNEYEESLAQKSNDLQTTVKLYQQKLADVIEREKKVEKDFAYAQELLKKADEKTANADALFQRLTQAISG